MAWATKHLTKKTFLYVSFYKLFGHFINQKSGKINNRISELFKNKNGHLNFVSFSSHQTQWIQCRTWANFLGILKGRCLWCQLLGHLSFEQIKILRAEGNHFLFVEKHRMQCNFYIKSNDHWLFNFDLINGNDIGRIIFSSAMEILTFCYYFNQSQKSSV